METVVRLNPRLAARRPTRGHGRRLPVTRDIGRAFVLSRVIAAGLGATALLELAGSRLGPPPLATTYPTFAGQDAATLLFVVPLLLASAHLAERGSVRALVCWLGLLFAVSVSAYVRLAATAVTPVLPAHIVLLVLSTYVVALLGCAIDRPALSRRFHRGWPIRTTAAFFLVLAALVAVLGADLARSARDAMPPLDAARTLLTPNGLLLVPLLVYAGIALWRRDGLGDLLAGVCLTGGVVVFLTLLLASGIAFQSGYPIDLVPLTLYGVGLFDAGALLIVYLGALPGLAGTPPVSVPAPARPRRVA